MRPSYPKDVWKNGTVGKYAAAYHAADNMRRLDRDVAKVFRDNDSVNEALRTLLRLSPAIRSMLEPDDKPRLAPSAIEVPG